MLAPSMLANAEDHVRRILEIVASREGVEAVVAANVEMRDGVPVLAPLHRGLIDAARLAAMYRELVPPGLPRILAGSETEAQLRALEGP